MGGSARAWLDWQTGRKLTMHIIESIAQQAGAMAALRRDLHAHPELRFEENQTA